MISVPTPDIGRIVSDSVSSVFRPAETSEDNVSSSMLASFVENLSDNVLSEPSLCRDLEEATRGQATNPHWVEMLKLTNFSTECGVL